MTVRLALIRHGHTQWNRDGRVQGHTDIPLAPDVVVDMARYQLPADWQQAALVSSPLQRARQSAALIARGEPELVDALMEMDWGEWEGRRGAEIVSDTDSGFRDVEQWGWHFTPPGGESPHDVRQRLMPWVQSLQKDTVAVCHIGIMRVLLGIAHGWEFMGPMPFEIKRKRLYVLQVDDDLEPADPAVIRLQTVPEQNG